MNAHRSLPRPRTRRFRTLRFRALRFRIRLAVRKSPIALTLLALLAASPVAGWGRPGQAVGEGGVEGGRTEVFHFAELDRRYEELTPDMVPVREGTLSVALSSPKNQLDLFDHRLTLSPRPDGTHDATLSLDFAGSGTLIAELNLGGAASRFEDELTVPRQRRQLAARVRITPVPEGYSITLVELPPDFEVAIESRLGQQLVGACLPLAALGLAPIRCDSLNRAFSQVQVPLPAAGETWFFEAHRLSPESRQQLDRYLGQSALPGPEGR